MRNGDVASTPELQAHLDELVRRIVEAVHPIRILLFGSVARGDVGPDSDVDVLVVMPDGSPKRETALFLHTRFQGLPFGVDVLIATPADLKEQRDNPGLIYGEILDEGKELYAA